jgi:hypothetical protein
MSHFTCLVIGPNVDALLQPYHEYECTGTDDEYVKDIDITDEARDGYAKATETRLQAADGTLHSFFDEKGEWRHEFSRTDPAAPTWDRSRRTRYVPPGYTVIEVPTASVETFAEYVDGYYGKQITVLDGVEKVIKRTNPNAHWDWWKLGGRWTGFFKLKDGASGEVGDPGLMTPAAKPGRADQALKSAIDFDSMRDEAGEKAGAKWDKAAALTGGQPWEAWEFVRGRMPIADARVFYNAQPAVVALKADEEFSWDVDDTLCGKRDAYVAAARDRAITTFALVHRGEWTEKGSMGWFGMSTGDMDQAEWNRLFNALIDGLPDDTLLSVVDCHI